MDDISTVELLLTRRLIQEDAEAIYSLLKSERNSIFVICALPYYVLFVQSCEEYARLNAFDDSTKEEIKNIRNNIKAYADRAGRTIRRIAAVDAQHDYIFRKQLRFDFMENWNIHYNLGSFWVDGHKIIGNTQMLADIMGIKNTIESGNGEQQMEFSRQISSYVSSIRSGLARNFSIPEIRRKNCAIKIPFYCDFNTNRTSRMIKKELPKEINLLFLHLLCSMNFVRYVLSDMFYPGNTWVFRILYITTYYAFYALGKLNNHVCNNSGSDIDIFPLESLLDEGKGLFRSDFRNCMMHYDLQGRGLITAENMNKPLFGLVENCFLGHSYESYSAQLEIYRNKVCAYLEQYFDFSQVVLRKSE